MGNPISCINTCYVLLSSDSKVGKYPFTTMICPQCKADSVRVIDSRDAPAEPAIRRRRECESCGFRFTTYERIAQPHVWIVKKDGRREQFDRDKLSRGIWRACEKRPISESQIESLLGAIEQDIRAQGEPEVAVETVGEIVMNHLRDFDEIAYIRFASVYRQFTDLGELQAEVSKAIKQQTKSEKRKSTVK